MARIELKYCTIYFLDGLNGVAEVNQPSLAPLAGDTTLSLNSIVVNTLTPQQIPVGGRFNIAGETVPQLHSVTSRTNGMNAGADEKQNVVLTSCSTTYRLGWGGVTTAPIAYNATSTVVQGALVALDLGGHGTEWSVTGSTGGPYLVEFTGPLGNAPQALMTGVADTGTVVITENTPGVVPIPTTTTTGITFTPPLGPGTYVNGAAVSITTQQLYVKIGEGNLTYTEHHDYQYLLDRGWFDTVREPKQVPLDVKVDAVYEHIASETGEFVSPMEALKGEGRASEWVSSSSDPCEPYCIDVLVEYVPPCSPLQAETSRFPMFRAETREINFSAATIAFTGKCFVQEPIITRPNQP